MTQKSINIAVLIIVIVGAGILAWRWQDNSQTSGGLSHEVIFDGPAGAPVKKERVIPDGWREYRNTEYRFSVAYPPDLSVKEYPEGSGAATITFQDTGKGEGFQIFIVPYRESQVSTERFMKDEPSGVRKEIKNLEVDGVSAAAFESQNASLGDTSEVWFIREGFLYEATAPRALDAWFGVIIGTWVFI